MPEPVPLSTLLAWTWVAHTIEADNLVEAAAGERVGRLFRISLAMWANALRCLDDDGTTVGELRARARARCNLGGLERWGWVEVGAAGTGRRPGYGSHRGITPATVVRPTPAGRYARRVWPRALEQVEVRWRARFGDAAIDGLLGALHGAADRPPLADMVLPWAPPEIHPSDGFRTQLVDGPLDGATAGRPLGVVLGQVLTAWTVELEAGAPVSLPLAANLLRVIGSRQVAVRDLPRLAGVSKEAIAMAVGSLQRTGLATVAPERTVALTERGRGALDDYRRRAASAADPALRAALEVMAGQGLAAGLQPPTGGWRSAPPYRRHTERLLADPTGSLPWQPMVLHRGGWPDGS